MMTTRYLSWLLLLPLSLCCANAQVATAQTTDAFSQSETDTELFNPFLTLDYSTFVAGQFGLPARRRGSSSQVFASAEATETTTQSAVDEPTTTIEPSPIPPASDPLISGPTFSSPSFVEETPANFSKEAPTADASSPDSSAEETSVEMPDSPPPVSSSARPPFRPRVRSPFRPPPIPVFGC